MLVTISFNTVIVNPAPSPNENYLWIPEVSDNVVPGLDPLITDTQSKYATLTALQNSITTTKEIILKLKLIIQKSLIEEI